MLKLAMAAGLTLLLAGCGGASTTSTSSSTSDTSSTTTTASSGAKDPRMSDPTTATGGSNDCSKNPAFAPLYTGGKIAICSSVHFDNTGKDNGSFTYTTDATPEAVLAFSKDSASKSGLTQRLATDKMFSAGDDKERTLMVLARVEDGATKVTVNWGYKP